MNGCDDRVTLAEGLTVPLSALRTLWALEDRGLSFAIDGDSIIVRPRQLLTDEDRAAIRQWREDVKAILANEAPAQ